MAFLVSLGMVVLYASLLVLLLVIAWALYQDQRRLDIPAGIKYPVRLRVLHGIFRYGGAMGFILEKLGIQNKDRFLDRAASLMLSKRSSTLTIKDFVFDGVPVRVYWPKTTPSGMRRGVVVIPAGGAIVGNIWMGDSLCRYISQETDSVTVNIAFRLAPEHPFPIPVMDCCTATAHFLKNAAEFGVDPNRIALYGECSGGTFATVVCQQLAARTDLPKPCAQVLIYPYFQAVDFNLPSYQQNQRVPILFKKRALKMGMMYLTGKKFNVEGVMRNAHLPKHVWMKYKKWVSPDLIPEKFKGQGYVPMEWPQFIPELYEQCKESTNPMFSPLLAEDDMIRQLPKTFILTCEYDVFRDDGLLYKKRLEDNGVPVTWYHVEDGFHGFHNPFLEFPTLQIHFRRVTDFINRI
uniref:Alpha/beta hydrolase fold-3 domain-containing protein n=2 Tax=Anolis carolinensis TaxID=28377 RepID=A0A803SY49_ANOCA|nr:PREDICTED: arylacetamide deacetylase-like 3 [Anolis carolinensis]|eukprot:XP_003229234.1 PREDICTED: arylacetamide deacetylase-like 3 [Anolis carolinensis]